MTDTVAGKPSTLPPITDLAQQVRDGTSLNTGGNHVGGGDWDRGLPIDTPVTHQNSRPRPTGLDWNAIAPAPEPVEIPADLATVDPYEAVADARYEEPADENNQTQDTPAKTGRPQAFTPEQVADMVRRYNTGESAPAIAQDLGCGANTVRRNLFRAGVTLRSPLEASAVRNGHDTTGLQLRTPETAAEDAAKVDRGRPRFYFTPEQAADIVHRYQLGETTTAIAASIDGAHSSTVRNVILRAGVKMRPRGRASATPPRDGLKLRDGDQPLPVKNDHPDIQSMVIADIQARRQVGIARYGTALQAGNGRDALRDLYEELVDACCYIKQVMVERDAQPTGMELARQDRVRGAERSLTAGPV